MNYSGAFIISGSRGQSLVEVSLVLALVAIIAIAVLGGLGLQASCSLAWTASQIERVISPSTTVATNYMGTHCTSLGPPYDTL
jgi:Flp pilus assembly pilin Flp